MAAINHQFAPGSVEALTPMPGTFYKIHTYILYRLQLKGWRINKKDLCNYFTLSMSTVKRALRWFRDHGYATWDQSQNKWNFFANSTATQPPVTVAIPSLNCTTSDPPLPVASEPPYIEVSLQRKEPQPTAYIPESVATMVNENVVVLSGDTEDQTPLVFPAQLTDPQRKQAKHVIKTAPMDMQQAILLVLAACMAKGAVKSPVAFLNGLITRAHAGTFEALGAGAGKPDNQKAVDATQSLLANRRATASATKTDAGKLQL